MEPSYPERELESLIKVGNEIRIGIGGELMSRLNDEVAIEELHARAQVLRTGF